HSHIKNDTEKRNVEIELSDLFSTLEKHQAGTHSITKKLKINNVFEHRDAAEHYEKILRNISPEASQIFHGQLTNRNKCKQCKTITKSKAGFWSLPLPLVNDNNEYSVEKGIEDFFRPSEISGDDQMYCEKCDKKCDAVLDCEVKHSPEVLVLLLKRFELKCVGNVWEKVKINCPVKIPDTLQIKQNEIYKLYAYVDHFGSLRQGHYTATIKSQDDGQWYIFDDLSIQVLSYNHFQLDPTQTSESVYLLFYQKQDDTNVDRHDTPNILPTTTLLSQTEDHHSSSEEKAADIKFVTKNQPVTPGSKRNMGGPRYDEQNESMRIRTNGDTETGQTFDQGKQSKHREPNLETFYRDCRDVNEKPKMHNKHNEGEEHGMAKMKQEYFSNEQSLQKVGRDKQHVSQHDITSAYYRHQDGMSYKDKDRQTRQVNHNNSYALSQNEKQWREQTKQTENSSDVYNKSINTNNKQNRSNFQARC
ncbi:ubl carboxyl-terminal hydrolase 18-like, partial [Boleophthalmus pectinirostris]|uniref:ubl carboxyl-terminal hydrolase 18-like n=1 Tax=Boleophthalmus pectinirostris TaxID=150288 RepID=UPI00242AD2EC